MPNSDTTYGVFNKKTRIYQILYTDDRSVVTQDFGGNVETAKNFFFTTDALANWNTNSTQLEWAITDDGNGLKVTNAFGTKGSGTPEADDWAGLWVTTKQSLIDASNWINSSALVADADGDKSGVVKSWLMTESSEHLF